MGGSSSRVAVAAAVLLAAALSACTSPPIRVLPATSTTFELPQEVTQSTLLPEPNTTEAPAASLVTIAPDGAGDAGNAALGEVSSGTPADTEPARLGDAAVPHPEGVVLDAEGLGIATFGMNVTAALSRLTDALGQPIADGGWTDAFGLYGDCPGSRLRGVEWPGVLVLFGNAEDGYQFRDADDEHFMAWRLGWIGPDPYLLRTSEGIGVGSTRNEVAHAYPTASFQPAGVGIPATVVIGANGGQLRGVFDDSGTLRTLEAGVVCDLG